MIRRSTTYYVNEKNGSRICLGIVFIMILSVGWIWLDCFLFNEYDITVVKAFLKLPHPLFICAYLHIYIRYALTMFVNENYCFVEVYGQSTHSLVSTEYFIIWNKGYKRLLSIEFIMRLFPREICNILVMQYNLEHITNIIEWGR